MAKTVPLDAGTLAWARGVFSDYYRAAPVAAPTRVARREFAAFPFSVETMMRRHATLPTEEELRAYLAHEVPRHVYYSSAYYRRPAAPNMAEKEWLGADLIFDLDADHLRGADALDYAGQLALVKRRLVDLLDDFLVRDFGLDAGAMGLAFSGGRGYHVHIHDERFLPMSSPERRELVDYVLGVGVEAMRAVEAAGTDVRSGRTLSDADEEPGAGRAGRVPRLRRLAAPDAPGWRGRTTRAVLAALRRWRGLTAAEVAGELTAAGIPRKKALSWAKQLIDKGGAQKIEETRALDVFKEDAEEFVAAVVPRASIEVQAETDAPVTTDIHRLIRLPGSLHGGSGLRVVPLDRDALDRFDPLLDAPLPDDGRRTAVEFREDVSLPFAGGRIEGRTGRADELPTPQAVFLVLRGQAALRPAPGR